ncbi:MDR1 [Candida metapsilosis]|uniref:MDR1 n=1 Tax=Candida metapsilosis TaxID=273372 RepID=A0A8H7ZKJ5_9ASCO|nr:MDR1 [Candida metapsilosis]
MLDFIRDSFGGRLIYHLSKHKYFSYPEEDKDYVIPEKYLLDNKYTYDAQITQQQEQQQQQDTEVSTSDSSTISSLSEKTKVDNSNDYIFVEWDGDDDPEDPRNWSLFKKGFFIFEVAFLTTSVYMASAVYTPGLDQLQHDLSVGKVVGTLGVFTFVLGYGIGPILWSPISENAAVGRSSIYALTLLVFVILQIPTALVDNIAGFCILRFLGGFFASPCLATGGASVGEVTKYWNFPLSLALWSIGAVCGPSLGPFFGAILTVKAGWRWTFWFIMIVSGFSLALLTFFLPETYAPTLLARKAKRLRARTGNDRITTEGLLENERRTMHQILVEALWRPIEVTILEPVVLLIDIYIAMVYSVLYLFFEVFPIYFVEVRGFTTIELGVTYLALIIGVLVAVSIYLPVIHHQFTKPILNNETVYPEVFIPIAIVGGCLFAVGLFIFGWSATTYTHWIGPLFGVAATTAGAFLMFQTLFNYMGASFKPEYLASVFASNDLVRSTSASVFPIFGAALFNNLKIDKFPVAWGSSVLGFIATAMIAIPVLFYLNGPKLRARSKYAK